MEKAKYFQNKSNFVASHLALRELCHGLRYLDCTSTNDMGCQVERLHHHLRFSRIWSSLVPAGSTGRRQSTYPSCQHTHTPPCQATRNRGDQTETFRNTLQSKEPSVSTQQGTWKWQGGREQQCLLWAASAAWGRNKATRLGDFWKALRKILQRRRKRQLSSETHNPGK